MSNQKKTKFTVFDILLVLIIIAAIGYVAYTLIFAPLSTKGEDIKVEFTVEMPITSEQIASLVQVGDTVTIAGKPSGTVTKVEYPPALKLGLDALDGVFKLSPVPNKYDLRVTVVADGTETDKEVRAAGTVVRVGATLSVEGRGYAITGTVLMLNVIDEKKEVISQ